MGEKIINGRTPQAVRHANGKAAGQGSPDGSAFRAFMAKKAWGRRQQMRKDFFDDIRDIKDHPITQRMKAYPHHGDTSCYQHCLNVAYYNYHICRFLGKDYLAAARAGMLHDLFLYDWHTYASETGDYLHGLTHPKAALAMAEKYFDLTDKEKDIILKHMWPLTLVPPKSFEAFLISLTDKYCGACEVIDHLYTKWRLGMRRS